MDLDLRFASTSMFCCDISSIRYSIDIIPYSAAIVKLIALICAFRGIAEEYCSSETKTGRESGYFGLSMRRLRVRVPSGYHSNRSGIVARIRSGTSY